MTQTGHCCAARARLEVEKQSLLQRIHALEVELSASNFQRREQDTKLDAANLTIEVIKDQL